MYTQSATVYVQYVQYLHYQMGIPKSDADATKSKGIEILLHITSTVCTISPTWATARPTTLFSASCLFWPSRVPAHSAGPTLPVSLLSTLYPVHSYIHSAQYTSLPISVLHVFLCIHSKTISCSSPATFHMAEHSLRLNIDPWTI